jgi:hypothetical protein
MLRRNCLLKHATETKIAGRTEIEVRRRTRKQLLDEHKKREDTGNLKRKHYIVLYEELAFEDVMNMSEDRLRIDEVISIPIVKCNIAR